MNQQQGQALLVEPDGSEEDWCTESFHGKLGDQLLEGDPHDIGEGEGVDWAVAEGV